MGIFNSLGRQNPQQPTAQNQQASYEAMMQDVGQIKADPGTYLKGKGYNIPDGMKDVRQITQYLLQTGQVGTPKLQQALQLMGITRR